MSESIVRKMRKAADPIWAAVLAHPFVQGIGDGSLSRDRFEFYLKQDYAYLIDFGRVLAMAAAKGDTLNDMQTFSALVESTLHSEMELHRRTCSDYGISAEQLEQTVPGLITTSYTSFLLRACYEGDFRDVLAVLLPCAAGYCEIAAHLKERGTPDHKHYRDWIDTYTAPEMIEVTNWIQDRLDELGAGAPEHRFGRWTRLYENSARLELMFFDMSWRKELWPDPIPDTSAVAT
ncbi:MAG: thiaminase II [candidate division Zixibacteria bacterium]|nr:thiaminase II [candidate division Zixibacteria bacterium]